METETIKKTKEKELDNSYNYLFHYNSLTELWAAFPREEKDNYFNGIVNEKIIKMSSIKDLHTYINKLNK
jgi:hypothetical protein